MWAVGAVLHHLIGGKPPFEADNEIQTLSVLSSGRPPPPLRGGVHPAVAAVVRRALSHAPDARYATAAQLQEALEEAIIQAGLSTTPATIAAYLAEQMGDKADRRKEAIALGLKAAEDREKVAAMMRSNTELPLTGTSNTGASKVSNVSAVTAEATSPSLSNGQTLGSAALSIRPPARSRGLRLAVVAGVLGAAVAVLALVVTTRGSAPAVAPKPQRPVAAAAAPRAIAPDPLPVAPVPPPAASAAGSRHPPRRRPWRARCLRHPSRSSGPCASRRPRRSWPHRPSPPRHPLPRRPPPHRRPAPSRPG